MKVKEGMAGGRKGRKRDGLDSTGKAAPEPSRQEKDYRILSRLWENSNSIFGDLHIINCKMIEFHFPLDFLLTD